MFQVTRVPRLTAFGWLADAVGLAGVVLAIPVGILLIGAPVALLIKGALLLYARLFGA